MSQRPSTIRALVLGLGDVLRAPLLLAGVALITLAIAVPFAAVLQSRLQASLSVQPHVNLDETEIDPEWWMEFREHARGLEATFTPAVLGFAATLDGISNVLDGNRIAAGIVVPLLLSMAAWAFMWGAVLQRFKMGRSIGIRGFARHGATHVVPFALIASVAAAVNLALYFSVHKLLFGPVYQGLAGLTNTERDAFFVRALLYVIFFAVIALVSLIADYARVAAVSGPGRSPFALLGISWTFIRTHLRAVVVLYVLTGAIFVLITVGYGALEVVGGSQAGGWRAIAIGQAYVLVRLAIRLAFGASELRLFNTSQAAAAE
jgi:hypothetical protein